MTHEHTPGDLFTLPHEFWKGEVGDDLIDEQTAHAIVSKRLIRGWFKQISDVTGDLKVNYLRSCLPVGFSTMQQFPRDVKFGMCSFRGDLTAGNIERGIKEYLAKWPEHEQREEVEQA